jgi:outer membrane biosynthesis protein TonB
MLPRLLFSLLAVVAVTSSKGEEQAVSRPNQDSLWETYTKGTLITSETQNFDSRYPVSLSMENMELLSESRTKKQVFQVPNASMTRIQLAWRKVLAENPGSPNGNIVMRWTITANGNISDIAIVSSTVKNPELDSSLVKIAKHWRWHSVERGESIVTMLFEFLRP